MALAGASSIRELEERYDLIAPWFPLWVRILEYRTRLWEIRQLPVSDSLIISPPGDPFLGLLLKTNTGRSSYLCLSPTLEKRVKRYCAQKHLSGLHLIRGYSLPFAIPDNHFDAVFANCLFDFCDDSLLSVLLAESLRILKPEGRLYLVLMDQPRTLMGTGWQWVFTHFPRLSGGCHPVASLPPAKRYTIHTGERWTRFGFPLGLFILKKR
ncbi:MAG: methyltransferase domain-containing protein [Fidelibacterota bacterium]